MPKTPITKNIVTLEHMDVTQVPVDSIHPNDYNPNRQSDRDFELLCRSIEEDGFTQPILVHEPTMTIVDGEHRWRACKVLGHTTVSVVMSSMTIEQMMIATLRHNRARGNENINLASDVLREIQKMGGIEGAADSLMMDDIEMKIMLEDIPSAELNLRTEGDKMSVADVKQQLATEREFQQQKRDEDSAQGKKDVKGVKSFAFILFAGELLLIKEVCGKENTVAGILALCEKYRNNKAAMKYIRETPSEPIPFKEGRKVEEIFLD